ncbi:unnamed protein product [Owenia fusiformis]|nr:unnamed protein product [Owenia fusiformis]
MKIENEESWSLIEASQNPGVNLAWIETDKMGPIVITATPKSETFVVDPQGVLYQARINRYLTVRFPKKATNTPVNCTIKITPFRHENLEDAKRLYHHQVGDLIMSTDYIEIVADGISEFRRPVGVRLPMPEIVEEFDQEDIAVLYKPSSEDAWQIFNDKLTFTKQTVSFDVKALSKYVVALSRPQRKRRLTEAFRIFDTQNRVVTGEILTFIKMEEKLWLLAVEIVQKNDIEKSIKDKENDGFEMVEKVEIVKEEKQVFRKHYKAARKDYSKMQEKPDDPNVNLINNSVFDLELQGDLCVYESNSHYVTNQFKLPYSEIIGNNHRLYEIQPKLKDGVVDIGVNGYDCEATLNILNKSPVNKDDPECIRTFRISIESSRVAKYFYEEPVPDEPEPEPEPVIEIPVEEPIPPPSPVQSPKPEGRFSTPLTESFMRLIKHKRPPIKIYKEPKVLSGRSLRALALEIPQGLTLAVHLDIPDSTMTGIGFDALSLGMGLADVTYKILVHWKRKCVSIKSDGDIQVECLINALHEMDRSDIADIVAERHAVNQELDPACFSPIRVTVDHIN